MSFILLGILNSQVTGAPAGAGDYDLLETTVLGSAQTTVTFSGLNSTYGSTYKHLQVRYTARDNFNDLTNTMVVLLNGAASGNYSNHYLLGNGSTVTSVAVTNNVIRVAEVPENQQGADIFGAGVIDFLDPFSTAKNTTVRSLSGHSGSSPKIGLWSGAYLSTDAIDSMTFDATSTSTFNIGSRFSLYGIKAA